MQNVKTLLAGTVLGATALTGVAQAAVSANIGVGSQYIFRGIQQTADAQVFGGLDWESDTSGLYAGTWVSSAAGNSEVDLYGGYAFNLGNGLTLDLGYIAYLYPSDPALADDRDPTTPGVQPGVSHGNSSELYLGLAGAAWSTTVWYNFGIDNINNSESMYVEGNVSFPLVGQLNMGLHLGWFNGVGDAFDTLNDDDYVDYGISIGAGDFSLAITNTDLDADSQLATTMFGIADRPQVTVSWTKSWSDLTK